MTPTANSGTNQPISLGPLKVAFVIDGRRVEVEGEAFQNYSPNPHVTIEVQDVPRSPFSPAEPIGGYGVVSVMQDGHTLRAPITAEGPSSIELGDSMTIDVVPHSWLWNEHSHAFRLAHSPCVTLDAEKPIAQMQFTVLNLVPQDPDLTRVFESHPWLVHIGPVENLSEMEKALAESGGYGVTHWGSFLRTDGAAFTSKDAAELLLGLDHFLSFVSGAYCSINTATGYDQGGAAVWKRWGSFHVSRWRRHRSWDDVTIAGALPDLFDAFWKEFRANKNGLARIIGLYAERNSTGNLDVSVILSQAALETSAHLWFDKQRGRSSRKWTAEALDRAKIPIAIPDCFEHLEELRGAEGWEHGPHCITMFRNPAAHAGTRSFATHRNAHHEVRQLALWYIEMMVLWRLGYRGEYASRLEPIQRAGLTELVPWSQNERTPTEPEP